MTTTFNVPVLSKFYEEVRSVDDLKKTCSNPNYRDVKKMILGQGSNVLFVNKFDGLVIKMMINGVNIVREDNTYVYVTANAGENWDDFVNYCVANNFGGLENLSGIPGTVGASPVQNIGAYGVEVKDVFESLEAFDLKTCKVRTFKFDNCNFEYRNSIFKSKGYKDFVITSVTFKLSKNPVLNIKYKGITDLLDAKKISSPSICDIRDVVLEIRKQKLPDISELGSAGSFFKNPIIGQSAFRELQKNYEDVPSFIVDDGNYKIPAGWLIESCGYKGKKFGKCGVYKDHALILVNYGGATGLEIKNLADKIKLDVFSKFKITLEEEVLII